MSNTFQSVGSSRPQSSKFDLSHNRKFSFKPGILYPILATEAVPSDVFNYDANVVVRMAPMLSPIMHMVDVCVHSFFYPDRLTQLRGNFEIFITGGKNGDGKDAQGNTIQPPFFLATGTLVSPPDSISLREFMGKGTLADYLGLQFSNSHLVGGNTQQINARPFIAFWRIYCEYFRDQNLDPDWVSLYPAIFDSPGGDITAEIKLAMLASAPNTFNIFELPRVCWDKDYFTSALPFAQRGEAVEAPLTGSATVTYKNDEGNFFNSDNTPIAAGGAMDIIPTTGDGAFGRTAAEPTKAIYVRNIESIDLNAGGFTITALRTAARLQEWLEKMATGGARYIEQIKAQFGVTSSDARLQRAEYLGGGKIPMHISEVIQSSADGTTTPLAEMAGHGVTAGQVTSFKKFCEEHGMLFTFIYLRPKPAYQQGLPRMWWNRFDKLDYLWPSFARIGEQEVLQKELFFIGDPTNDDDVFGYQQRYAEYKYIPSTVHGDFQDTLDFWHWGRIFSTAPTLSSEFVHCDPSDRIFNVLNPSSDSLYCIVQNRITAKRPLPYYGEPML